MENSQNFKTEELFETFNTEDIHTNPTTELSEQVLDTSSFGFQTQHAQSQDNNFIPFPVITGSNAQGISQNGAQDFKQEPRSGIRIADFAIDPDSCAIIDQAQDSISTPREQENPTQPPPPVSANSRVYVFKLISSELSFQFYTNYCESSIYSQSISKCSSTGAKSKCSYKHQIHSALSAVSETISSNQFCWNRILSYYHFSCLQQIQALHTGHSFPIFYSKNPKRRTRRPSYDRL